MEKEIQKKIDIKGFIAKYGVILGLIIIMSFFTIMKAKFLTVDNMPNMLRQTSINGLLAIGMTFVVLTELGHKAWDGPVGDALKKEMPSERFVEPDEVAGIIAFLCSNAAGMITGHNLLIDGGYTIK